jgi:hypothetical protein
VDKNENDGNNDVNNLPNNVTASGLLFGRRKQLKIKDLQVNLRLIIMSYQLGIGQAGLSTVVGRLGLTPSLTNHIGWKAAEE